MGRGLLSECIAVITGAGQGLGRAIATEYADEGATVVLIERNPATLADLESSLRAAGHQALCFNLDVTDYLDLARAVEETIRQLGQIDVLVNNAGIFRNGTILADTLDDWRDVLNVNLEA